MKKLARSAACFGSPFPIVVRVPFCNPFAIVMCSALILMLAVMFTASAFAQGAVASAPVGDGVTGGLISLWGPLLGVLVALVTFCDRLAKVIPNSTTSSILNAIRIVATVLGAKVQDKQ
jgi:hypothetical protein